MNRSLRRRHRWMIPIAGLLAAVALIAGLGVRTRPVPIDDLSILARSPGPTVGQAISHQVLSSDSLLDIALWVDREGGNRLLVGLRARAALPYPSGQVLLRPGGSDDGSETALGPLAGQRWAWFPVPAVNLPDARVMIYSPGLATMVDSGPLPPLNPSSLDPQ